MNSILHSKKTKFALIMVIAFGIRMVGIASRPIWYDEAFSILFSEKGLSAMLYGTLSQTATGSADIHPLGYYTILWVWINIFGRSVLTARLFSIFISLLSLGLVYQIAKILFDEKTAMTAALLFSILPFQVHYAQEIRMYSLLSFWLLLATYSFLRGRYGNWKWWIVFAVSSALAQYTHNLAAIYLIPLAVTPIFQKDWQTLKAVVAASIFSILLYLPWLIHLPAQFEKVQSSYWVERPGLEKIFTLILFYLPHLPLPNNLLLPELLIATLTIALAVFQMIITRKNGLGSTNKIIWTAYLAFIPPLLLWLVSQYIPVYIERALLPANALFCVWLASAFTQAKPPRAIQAIIFIFILFSSITGIYQHIAYKGFPYGPYAELNKSIQSRMEIGDVIIHSNKLSYLPALYYDRTLPQGFIIDPPNSNVDTLAPATREILKLTEFENIEKGTTSASRVWFIIYQQSIDEFKRENKTHPDMEYLNNNFALKSIESWDDIKLYLYIRNKP
jgi:4-amino-4-deoxy-L-arabinose transferase-like glycosyltransferase